MENIFDRIDNAHSWPEQEDYVGHCYECDKWFLGPRWADICYPCHNRKPIQLVFDFAM